MKSSRTEPTALIDTRIFLCQKTGNVSSGCGALKQALLGKKRKRPWHTLLEGQSASVHAMDVLEYSIFFCFRKQPMKICYYPHVG